jgi:histidinol-phosphate aminotransferase
LKKLGIPVPHSHANFVFADLDRPAGPVYEQLLRRGIITRPVPGSGWPNALRISAGLQSQNERLVQAMAEVLKT